MSISIAITTYNRVQSTLDSFRDVLFDKRVHAIYIIDDCSDTQYFNELQDRVNDANENFSRARIFLYRNYVNKDCYFNKAIAIEKCETDWCILLDSDNRIGIDYIDAIWQLRRIYNQWEKNVVYQPSFARPHFDFGWLSNRMLNKQNIAEYIDIRNASTMLNAMNYFVNKQTYLDAFDSSVDPVTSDSLYQNFNLLKNGNSIFVVPGLEYDHPISNDSHYKLNHKRTPHGFHEEILQKLRELR